MLAEDAAGDGQAETGASGFVRDKRREQAGQDFGGDSRAGIADFDLDLGLAFFGFEAGDMFGGEHDFGAKGQRAAAVHGVDGVEEEVEERLLELARVGVDQVLAGVEQQVFLDAMGLDLVLHEAEGVPQEFVHAGGTERRLSGPGEPQQLTDEQVDPAHFTADQRGGVVRFLLEEKFDEGFDGDEGVFDFVSDAGGEGADGGEFLEALGLGLEFAGGGEVVENEECQRPRAGRVLPRKTGGAHHGAFAGIVFEGDQTFGRGLISLDGFGGDLFQRRRQEPGGIGGLVRARSGRLQQTGGWRVGGDDLASGVDDEKTGFGDAVEDAGEFQVLAGVLAPAGFVGHRDCRRIWLGVEHGFGWRARSSYGRV